VAFHLRDRQGGKSGSCNKAKHVFFEVKSFLELTAVRWLIDDRRKKKARNKNRGCHFRSRASLIGHV
jgi:hypothetical protein